MTAEAGHQSGRWYSAQDGSIHLNGAPVYNAAETDITSNLSSAGASVAASTAITGTQEAETNFDTTVTLAANTLKAGTRLKIRAQGIHTATTGSETHTILLKLGSTTLASKASIDPADNNLFYFDFEVVCRTAGASGTMVGCGLLGTGASGTGSVFPLLLAETSIDTTGALVVAVAIDRQSTATDTDSARLDFLTVDVLN